MGDNPWERQDLVKLSPLVKCPINYTGLCDVTVINIRYVINDIVLNGEILQLLP